MTRWHLYDDASGWCTTCTDGFAHRDDGRHTSPGGHDITPGPNYTPEELDAIKSRIREVNDRRYHR